MSPTVGSDTLRSFSPNSFTSLSSVSGTFALFDVSRTISPLPNSAPDPAPPLPDLTTHRPTPFAFG